MSKTPVKSSMLLAAFEDEVNQGLIDPVHVTNLGVDSTGTHLIVRRLVTPEKKGRRPSPPVFMNQTLLISDLTSFKIARVGRTAVSIAINGVTATVTSTISPVLPDSTLANWRVLHSITEDTVDLTVIRAAEYTLLSTSSIRWRARRFATVSATTFNTDNAAVYPSDTQVDIGAGHSHASDSVGNVLHGHTNPSHLHTLAGLPQVDLVTIDWAIVHV